MAKPMTASERQQCLALYGEGATLEELAERYDRHRCTIDSLIRRAGQRRGHQFRKPGPRVFKHWEREVGIKLGER